MHTNAKLQMLQEDSLELFVILLFLTEDGSTLCKSEFNDVAQTQVLILTCYTQQNSSCSHFAVTGQ